MAASVDQPPKIIDVPARPAPPMLAEKRESPTDPGGPPIHPLSAVLLVVVDNLWNLADWAIIGWVVTIPLSFLTVCVPTYFLQRFLRHDSRGKALAIGILLGVLAAVPFSITGTPAGLAILAWAGIAHFHGKPKPGSPS